MSKPFFQVVGASLSNSAILRDDRFFDDSKAHSGVLGGAKIQFFFWKWIRGNERHFGRGGFNWGEKWRKQILWKKNSMSREMVNKARLVSFVYERVQKIGLMVKMLPSKKCKHEVWDFLCTQYPAVFFCFFWGILWRRTVSCSFLLMKTLKTITKRFFKWMIVVSTANLSYWWGTSA